MTVHPSKLLSVSMKRRGRLSLLVVSMIVGTACGGSALIRPDDGTFARAQDRLAKTAAAVHQLNAPEPERLLFMQGESMYRYRFDPPPRSVGGYVAQAAAAALDFPALQAVAASLDLFDLRLKMHDGAVQIWESFLARHPRSALRPLTLYRLGWAYRSKISPGFPREDPHESLDQLMRDHPTSSLVPFALEARRAPWKSQDTAAGLSIIPGLGQMYVGETGDGAVRLAIALAAAAMILTPSYIAWQRRDDLTFKKDWPLLAVGLGGLIILSIDYTMTYTDAQRAVMQFNEREEQKFEDRTPNAP